MKKSLYLGASMLAVAAAAIVPASAADMYRGEPGGYKDGPVYVPANTWTGFYIGAHVGGAWGSEKTNQPNDNRTVTTTSSDPSGLFGGGQLGYNWQHGNVVFGVEADLGAMDLADKRVFANSDFIVSQKGGLYGDVTGRLGYAFGPALVYAKGGFAFFEGKAQLMHPAGETGGAFTATDGFTGWTIGGGLEYALSPAWSVKAEYLHFDFGREDSTFSGSANVRFGHDLTVDTVKAGLNYHVGQGYEPLK